MWWTSEMAITHMQASGNCSIFVSVSRQKHTLLTHTHTPSATIITIVVVIIVILYPVPVEMNRVPAKMPKNVKWEPMHEPNCNRNRTHREWITGDCLFASGFFSLLFIFYFVAVRKFIYYVKLDWSVIGVAWASHTHPKSHVVCLFFRVHRM